MDKILLTAFLSALAGLITFVISIVKLVNDKESKTTDYRQSWTDSAREALASLISKINSHTSELAHYEHVQERLLEKLHSEGPDELDNEDSENADSEDAKKRIKDILENSFKDAIIKARETKRDLYYAYAFARLHFKPDDISFNRIEQKFDVVMSLIQELSDTDNSEKRSVIKERVHSAVNEITGYARNILKSEWEIVKRGEPAYQKTKRFSLWGGGVMIGIILVIGTHAAVSIWKQRIQAELTVSAPEK